MLELSTADGVRSSVDSLLGEVAVGLIHRTVWLADWFGATKESVI